jgi:hypothetical protein
MSCRAKDSSLSAWLSPVPENPDKKNISSRVTRGVAILGAALIKKSPTASAFLQHSYN